MKLNIAIVPMACFTLLAQSVEAQRVLFHADFETFRTFPGEMLHTIPESGWDVARPGSNTPEVNVTVTYGVAAAGTPGGGFVQKLIGDLGLTSDSIVQIDMVGALSSRLAGSTSNTTLFNIAVGIGNYNHEADTVDTAPVQFGSSHDSFYIRLPGWGAIANAQAPGGGNRYALGINIYTHRFTLDLATGFATYEILNHTAEETSFSQLYFNADQTVGEIQTGVTGFETWDTIWMRTGASGGARIMEVTVTDLTADPGNGGNGTWAGYPVDANGWLDTGDRFGLLKLMDPNAGWVWSQSFGKWLMLAEDDFAGGEGFWAYIVAE